jgi:hypothetical protein
MVPCSETQADDAIEVTTRSAGCAAALLPRAKSITTWWNTTVKKEKTISNSKAAGDSSAAKAAGNNSEAPRSYLEIESSSTEKKVDEVRTPTLTAEQAWHVMRGRFLFAHSAPSSLTRCEDVVFDARDPDAHRGLMRTCSEPRELNVLMVLTFGDSSE